MNRIYRVIWNCTLQVFQACSELTRRAGKTSTVNLRKSSGLTTKFSRLTLGVLLALSGSASGASLEVDNDQITNIDTDVAYDAYLVGWYGTGMLNILAGGNASLTTITTSVIGANEDSEGTVNVLGGTWRLYDSGNNARPLNVGQSGTGTLNIKQKGHVDGGYLRLGSSTGGVGTVNVEGEDSVLTTELFEIGSYGTGSLNITDKGYVTSSIVAILGYQAGSNGQVVVEKGGEWLIKNNDSSIEFQIGNQGTGEATIREGGLITAENTIIGGNATGVGTLNVQDQDSVITVRRLYNGYFGNGTLNISNNGLINNKEYSLVGVQDGSHGVVNVTDKGHWNFLGTGEAFRYIYIGDAGDGELNVSREGKVDSGIITAGMKETGTGNITVKDKNSVITNLGTNLGYDGHGEMNISNEGLVVSNGGSSLGYGETGVGNVSITTGGMWEVNKNVYTTIGVAGVGNLNISDGGKFVSQNITFLGDKASGIGTLNLMDATSSFDTVGINVGNFGSGIVNVSNGATLNSTGYGFIGGNASGKGIVNISTDSLWNLKTSSTNAQLLQVGVLGKGELNITTGGIVKARDTQIALNDKSKGDVRVDGQNSLLETFNMYVGTSGTGTLTLTNSGTLNVEGGEVYFEGDLAINTVRQVSLSNGQNDYQGATYVQMGTLRTDADGALGNTRELNISNAAIVDLNGSTQTVETFTGQMGSTVLFKEGALTVNKGGISQGELTGGGNLNVTGGTLAIEGLNARYNALTSISPNAEVSLDNTQGLGRGNIANDGLLTLKNVTGELRNSISGKGIVSATARTDVELDGDNSRFVGQFNIDTGSALSVNEQKNLGDASVINNGLLTISTERSWAMTHSISGSGDVTKLGTGILTLNNDSAAYQGTTDIVGGEIAFGSDSAINMASQHINIHNSGVMSGNVTTAGDVNVMPGGTLRVAKTTIGGNLENGGTVQMNSEGGKPGNVLTVNGNYTGNNGLMTFNATLGGDNSPTDKMNVKGDTQGNTRVRVDNIGGVGAQTVNGIELIEVGGNSAGNFALTTGTVEAGAYVYTLAKGKGNDEKNWYLTSKWDGVTPPDTPDPINNPPVVDPEGPSVYRPEAGSYISNIAAANSLFSHRLHDRLGEPQYIDSLHSQGSASSMWMRHVGGHERSRAGDGQLNTQANRYVLQLGGDLAQWSSNAQDRWHLGVMAGYANQHSNTQSNRVGYKSDGRISGYSAGLYATWYQNDANKTGAYVDSWALYNWFDNSVSSDNRSADDYDSRGVTASVEGGYTFEAGTFSGSEETLNTWYVQPQAQITWMGVKDSDHTRKDGTRIETEGDGNVQTRLGVKTYLNSHHQRDDGKQREFQPYIEANWINNSKVYAVKMNGQTVGREGARNLGEVRTGVEAKVNNNLSLWGNVGVQLGDKGYSDTQGMLGVKYSW
ncbi:autotransporter outer membrane beta-barrel domain-containing protein [Escherichia coli]|uniref:autotransporter outer membrane beta-barrel domain-containing protein n=1 Tax=Escherichia coli TaxID=562 RepID=UPI00137307B8|nr:autotransporter outer membrane beta-barrel domain-containing protein [Escherichia coli]NAP09475.1 autotransporter outer membrane beta-barrel domain-containing protein [Escherichia coli]